MPPASDLTAHTGYWLRMVSNAVSQDFARKVADEGVTVAEWSFMRALYDADAMAPSALAEKMGMTKGAISKLADRLLGKGLDHPRRQSGRQAGAHPVPDGSRPEQGAGSGGARR